MYIGLHSRSHSWLDTENLDKDKTEIIILLFSIEAEYSYVGVDMI